MCDCGRSSVTSNGICERCLFLDGHSSGEYRIIDALRRQDGLLRTNDIAALAGVNPRSVYRHMPGLVERGRVRRVMIVFDGFHRTRKTEKQIPHYCLVGS